MRIPALLLVGGAMLATTQAQAQQTGSDLHPMPDTLPLMFFSPQPLAGTMLEPLAQPERAVEASAAREEPAATAEAEAVESTAAAGERAEEQPAAADVAQADVEATVEPVEPAPEEAAGDANVAPQPEPQRPPAAIVHIIVENVESNSGVVNVAVCDKSLSQEGCPYRTSVPASHGFVEALIEDVPPGTYAVVGYHDVNANKEFDRIFGVPREPYALSGEAGDTLVPEFTDATLRLNQGVNYVIIRMRRLGS